MSEKCPFKGRDVCIRSLDPEQNDLFGQKYNYCPFIGSGRRAFEGELYNECVGEKNCPIFQKGDLATLIHFLGLKE